MAVQNLTDALDVLTLSEPECLLFNPTGRNSLLREGFNDIPRYLFRIFTPMSDGETDRFWAKSKDASNDRSDYREDILSRDDEEEVASMLSRHLNWKSRYADSDNLVSWTSSLLFALQYIFYRHTKDGSTYDQISFCVIDTTKFSKGVFLRDMDLIRTYTGFSSDLVKLFNLRRGGTYYFGEYLSQGALKIEDKCQIVSAQAIIDQGLFSLPVKWGISSGWANDVVRLRKAFSEQEQASEITKAQLEVAVRISQLFKPGWKISMAAYFIALLPRRLIDVAILQTFRRKLFTDAERGNCSPSSTRVMAYNLPEIKQCDIILRSVYNDFCLRELRARLQDAESALRGAIIWTLNKELEVDDLILGYQDLTLTGPYHKAVLRQLDTIKFLSDSLKKKIGVVREHDDGV
ncbi:hypothetical protein V8E51_018562 [Hyaloscypha variabilis]